MTGSRGNPYGRPAQLALLLRGGCATGSGAMKVCFILEECYRHDGMPLEVARKMAEWGHDVDVLEPGKSVAMVSDLVRESNYDAWILKTVSDGPGLSLLEVAAASGMTTINDARAIRPVRDK